MDQRVEEIRKETKDRKETNGHNEQYGRTQGHEDLSIPFFFYAPKSVFKLCAQPLARPFVLSLPVKHAYPVSSCYVSVYCFLFCFAVVAHNSPFLTCCIVRGEWC